MFSCVKVVHLKTNFVFPNGFIYNSKWRVRAVAATLETVETLQSLNSVYQESLTMESSACILYCQESFTMGSVAVRTKI